MPYVSARYAPPPAEGEPQQVIATDETSVQWWLTEDSQIGDWLRYVEEGGTIDPATADVSGNITSSPDNLFGGPTLKEVFHGNQ